MRRRHRRSVGLRAARAPRGLRLLVLVTVTALLAVGLPTSVPLSASAAARSGFVTAWGLDTGGNLEVPASLDVTGATAVASGLTHNLALTPAGRVVTWGRIYRLGATPAPDSLARTTVTAIAAGDHHSLALTTDGKVIAWGDDSSGQRDVPASLDDATVIAIAGGGGHSLALTSAGRVVAWGDDSDGQTDVPVSLAGRTVTAVAAGGSFSLALTADGQVVQWGYPNGGRNVPPDSLRGTTVTAIDAGSLHSLALTAEGRVVAWGDDSLGQLDVPASLAGKKVTAIAAGTHQSLALTSDGTLTAWGSNSFGESEVPDTLTGGTVIAMAAGQRHNLAITQGAPLQVVSSPRSTRVELGDAATFSATATGIPAPAVRWQRADPGGAFVDVPGATSSTYTFTPVAADDGATFRAVFTSSAGAVTTAAATLSVNRPPTARPLALDVGFEKPTPITLSGTDPDGDPLTYAVVGQPRHGTLSGTPPQLTYTPAEDYSGPDAFSYVARDATRTSAEATVTLTVAAASCVPVPPRQTFRVSTARRTSGRLVSPSFRTKEPGQLLLAFVSVTRPRKGKEAPSGLSGGGLTWTLVQRNSTGRGTSEVWQARADRKLGRTRVTAALTAHRAAASLIVVGFSGARPTVGSTTHGSGTRSAPEVTLTPEGSGSLVWAAGRADGSRYRPKPVAGQKVVAHRTFRSPAAGHWTQRVRGATGETPVTVADKATARSWSYVAVEVRGVCR